MARNVTISNGPSVHDMMLSLIVGSEAEDDRRTVVFELGEGTNPDIKLSATVRIDMLEREDGSGNNWNFRGYQIPQNDTERNVGPKVKGYYSSTRRKGVFEWID